MKKCNGNFVTARQPTPEQACLSILGMQIASTANFIFENMDMFSDAVSDDDFDKWLEKKTWVR
ncbi:MAG: hypothetical protein Q4D26_12110 [Clostridia bacterium]|nr:hypothetical protein [Clostridia bacterium]